MKRKFLFFVILTLIFMNDVHAIQKPETICYLTNNHLKVGQTIKLNYKMYNFDEKNATFYLQGANHTTNGIEEDDHIEFNPKTKQITGLKEGISLIGVQMGDVTQVCNVLVTNSGKITKKYASDVKANNLVNKNRLKAGNVKIKIIGDTEVWKGSTIRLNIQNLSNNSNVTWKSNNPNIATVNNNGLVTGIKSGITIISATIGNKKLKHKVVVKKIQNQSVMLKGPNKIKIGKTKEYYVKNARNCNWTVSNPNIALFSIGTDRYQTQYSGKSVNINAKKVGKVKIKVNCNNVIKTKTIKVISN